jgi:5-methylcytosine-specific restriction endonuclease McrA
MNLKQERKKSRRQQLRINSQLKKKLYKHIAIAPCCYCKELFLTINLTIEHIVPLSLGGTNDASNIDLACAPCNRKKGKETWLMKKQLFRNKILTNASVIA